MKNDRIDDNLTVSRILGLLKQYLDGFDCSWTSIEQQDHLDKCYDQILKVLHDINLSTVNIDDIQQEVDQAFDEVSRSLESMDSLTLSDFSSLTSALADLRQSIIKIISRLANELNVIKTDVTSLKSQVDVLQNKVIHLEAESHYMKKMHLISDLFGPFMSKVYSLMSSENLSPTALTRTRLEQIQQHIKNEIHSNNETMLDAMVIIVKKVANEFQVNPLIAIDYCLKKKIRNDAVPINQQIHMYSTSTQSNQRTFAAFLASAPELEYQFFSSRDSSFRWSFSMFM